MADAFRDDPTGSMDFRGIFVLSGKLGVHSLGVPGQTLVDERESKDETQFMAVALYTFRRASQLTSEDLYLPLCDNLPFASP